MTEFAFVDGADIPVLDPEDLQGASILNQRTRFFPAWWIHITDGELPESEKPHYNVHCFDAGELAVAKALQPDIVRAHYYLADASSSTPSA